MCDIGGGEAEHLLHSIALIPFFYWFKKEKKNIEQPIIVETVIKQTVVEEPVAKKAPVKKKINKKVNKK